jgi:hypothetical protein
MACWQFQPVMRIGPALKGQPFSRRSNNQRVNRVVRGQRTACGRPATVIAARREGRLCGGDRR